MTITTLREKLHEYIETADERHLSAIYVLVENDNSSEDSIYDEETMKMLYQRREDHRNGISKSYTAEESINLLRQRRK